MSWGAILYLIASAGFGLDGWLIARPHDQNTRIACGIAAALLWPIGVALLLGAAAVDGLAALRRRWSL